jgi:hypothetical protein
MPRLHQTAGEIEHQSVVLARIAREPSGFDFQEAEAARPRRAAKALCVKSPPQRVQKA